MTGVALAPYHEGMSTFETAGHAMAIAEQLAKSQFVPAAFRGKPDDIMACILTGHEVGITPMQALQKIHVIDGRPAMAAELMRGLVLAAGHEIWIEESSSTRAVVCGKRKGSDREQKFIWNMDDAKRAGLAGRGNWGKYPQAMLVARASAALCRAVFPDVLGGISFTTEELTDGDVIDTVALEDQGAAAVNGTAAPAGARTRARRAATRGSAPVAPEPAPVPVTRELPPLPGEEDEIQDAEVVEDPPEPEVHEGPALAGPAAIAVAMGNHDVKDRDAKLRACSQILGRDVGSSKDLTDDEVGLVLGVLAELGAGAPFPFVADEAKPPPPDLPTTPAGWKKLAIRHKVGFDVLNVKLNELGVALDEVAGDNAVTLFAWLEAGGQ